MEILLKMRMRHLAKFIVSWFLVIDAFTTASAQEINASDLLHHVATLSADSLAGRQTGTIGAAKARAYIIQQFKRIKLEPVFANFEQKFEFPIIQNSQNVIVTGCNLIGKISGKRKIGTILISAHYDHLGIMDGQIYNGADDNASGVAALLEIAHYFSQNQPGHDFVFCAFDAEEQNFAGSKYFVANRPFSIKSIDLNVNLDMISINPVKTLYIAGAFHYPFLETLLRDQVNSEKAIKVVWGHDKPELGKDDWTFLSDHAAFHRDHIPFLYFGVEDHQHNHKPSDIFENINQDFFLEASEFILSSLVVIDNKFVKNMH